MTAEQAELWVIVKRLRHEMHSKPGVREVFTRILTPDHWVTRAVLDLAPVYDAMPDVYRHGL